MKSDDQFALTFLPALGVVCALGRDKSSVLEGLLRGNRNGLIPQASWLPDKSAMVGEVVSAFPDVPERLAQYRCRNNQLVLAACEQIDNDLRQAIARYGRDRIAVVLGSSTSGILEGERAAKRFEEQGDYLEDYHYKQQEIGSPAEFLAAYYELDNLAYTVSTACSSSAKAFLAAQNLLRANLCDGVIVGGVDSLCQLTVNGFSALSSMSDSVCNPFSKNRDGINIGEGAAIFLMTREHSDIELVSVGESSDAHHISAPHPEGNGAEQAMRQALALARVAASDVQYINLHGTATPKNDEMESRAVYRIFGDRVHCSSTKSLVGHTLGAAGAIESAFCWLLMSAYNVNRLLPKHQWDGFRDEAIAPIGLLQKDEVLSDTESLCLLSNSFAFGGSNASVLLRKFR